MPIVSEIKNRWGYVIAFILLLITYFLIFYIIKKLEKDAYSVSHSYAVINNLESIKGEITDAETGIRGYVITNNLAYLKPYNSGSRRVLSLYDELRAMTADSDLYKIRIDSLGQLIRLKLDFLSSFLTQYQQTGNSISSEMMISFESGNSSMLAIRNLINSLKDEEHMVMNSRNGKLKNFFQTMAIMAIVSLIITLVTIIYSLVTYSRENKAKEEADNKARVYRLELEGRINELNKVNSELSELKSIEKFAASGRIARTIAHEVRNPLTNISLASEQLKETGAPDEDTELLLGMIDRSVNRINQLVSDLLNATRIEQLEFAPANINLLLDEALVQALDRIELKHIRVEKQYDEYIPDLIVDREKLKLAFLNIIVNAVEAMKDNTGLLGLKTSKMGDKCFIECKDNGAGMDEETRQNIFEPYFTSKPKGNGLGLTHTQNIILKHKGSIQVKSKPGEGSVFTITLNIDELPV